MIMYVIQLCLTIIIKCDLKCHAIIPKQCARMQKNATLRSCTVYLHFYPTIHELICKYIPGEMLSKLKSPAMIANDSSSFGFNVFFRKSLKNFCESSIDGPVNIIYKI